VIYQKRDYDSDPPFLFLFHTLMGMFIYLVRVIVFNATFKQYFSYIVVVSFIGGENRSTGRKPLTCNKSLTNFST